jgi:hypothetical protein
MIFFKNYKSMKKNILLLMCFMCVEILYAQYMDSNWFMGAGTGWDGNITLSAALSAVLGLSVTFSINIYYQGQ